MHGELPKAGDSKVPATTAAPKKRSRLGRFLAYAVVLIAIAGALYYVYGTPAQQQQRRRFVVQGPVPVLAAAPMRGGLPTSVPTDPTIYRFYEALQVYGGALKEVIAEQFGDGIMSAINFSLDVQKKPHPAGDRVVVTFDGKFLPYQWVEAQD